MVLTNVLSPLMAKTPPTHSASPVIQRNPRIHFPPLDHPLPAHGIVARCSRACPEEPAP